MDIVVVNINDIMNMKVMGKYPEIPVPRKGEKVFCGYTPPTSVLDVLYLYEEKQILVKVDGHIINGTNE